MTDFDSEKFYEDLRQKLEGYGSVPPETVWTGIREQAPVRKRWRRPVLVLALVSALIGCLTVGTGRWQPLFPSASTTLPAGSAPDLARTASAAGSPSGATVRKANPSAEAGYRNSPLATASATAATPALGAPHNKSGSVGTASPTGGRTFRRHPALPASTAARAKRTGRTLTGASTEAGAAKRAALLRATASTKAGATTGHRTRRRGSSAASLLASNPSARARTLYANRNSSESAARARAARAAQHRSLASRSAKAAATSLAETEVSLTDAARQGSRQARARQPKISNAPLALRVVHTAVKNPKEPIVRTTKRSPRRRPTRRELRLRNWSGQLLLGSGLTYRVLGGAPTQLERLERPSLGFSGQATATYALSRELAVSAGLGYAEYATSLKYQLKKTASDQMVQKDFRDVYRFLTIPVQAQLTLGGTPRWRYGVLGGGTAAILADAQTTEGSACNCQQQKWSSSTQDMPFTRTNLLLTGGVFTSYQFGLGQWLTIRPQGQLFLNSLSTEASGRTARRLWSLGVQAGYSWDLDPRKR